MTGCPLQSPGVRLCILPMSNEEPSPPEGEPRRRRFKAGQKGTTEVATKRGLNQIPRWLTQEKGLPDWLAGSLVVIAGGLLIALLVWILILIFPAR